MKTSRFSDAYIIAILNRAEAAPPRNFAASPASARPYCYKWRSKYGGMDASLMARLKELKDEKRHLKKMYAEEPLKAEIISEAMAKSGDAICP